MQSKTRQESKRQEGVMRQAWRWALESWTEKRHGRRQCNHSHSCRKRRQQQAPLPMETLASVLPGLGTGPPRAGRQFSSKREGRIEPRQRAGCPVHS